MSGGGMTFLTKRVLHKRMRHTHAGFGVCLALHQERFDQAYGIARQRESYWVIMVSAEFEIGLAAGEHLMTDYPKHIKKQLNTLMSVAYERELTRELTQLAARFDDWRAGKIEAGELHDLIHQYHQGPGLEIYKRYDFRDVDWTVARAVALGLLSEDEILADVWSNIESRVQFLRRE
jgi:hypothetical protein